MTSDAGKLFPASVRVRYSKAPLYQVTCQLKFPPILRIGVEVPAGFQDLVRDEFPLLEQVVPTIQNLPPIMMQALQAQMGNTGVHKFATEDRSLHIELSPEALTMIATRYETWGVFKRVFDKAIDALVKTYRPASFSRVGIRYQDLIERSALNLADIPWSSLIRGELLGEAGIPRFEANLLDAKRLLRVRLPGSAGTMLLQHGLATKPNSTEVGYMIDLDFSTEEKTEIGDVQRVLGSLHREVGHAFRWCITERLHDALEPVEIGNDGDH